MSKQSRAILEIIHHSGRHMTAEEIYTECQKREIRISVASVYRNLSTMVEAGEIRKLSFPDGPDRYDKSVRPHAHLLCEICGRVSDLMIPELIPLLEEQAGVKLHSYELTVKYVCPECEAK